MIEINKRLSDLINKTNLNKDQLNKGIKEIKEIYPNKILFNDILICIKYKR